MKLIHADSKRFVFEIGRREKSLLCEILKLYPLVPAAHHHLSKAAPPVPADHDGDQRLLDEALAAQRNENRKQVVAMLNEPGRFEDLKTAWRFTLLRGQVEWLLQVLNDVRVGSWLALGSPDADGGGKIPSDTKAVPHFLAMEVAGGFEMALLEALNGQRRH